MEKESSWLLEEGAGHLGRLDSCETTLGENEKKKKQLEINLSWTVKENRNSVYKYISNKERAKVNLCPLLDAERSIVVKYEKKILRYSYLFCADL